VDSVRRTTLATASACIYDFRLRDGIRFRVSWKRIVQGVVADLCLSLPALIGARKIFLLGECEFVAVLLGGV